MRELTAGNVEVIVDAAKKFLVRLRNVSFEHEISVRIPKATATALRSLALDLRQQGQKISYQQVEDPLWEAMETSFIDSRIYEVADRLMIDVSPTLNQVVKLCADEIFKASKSDLSNALLFLDLSISMLQLSKQFQQRLVK